MKIFSLIFFFLSINSQFHPVNSFKGRGNSWKKRRPFYPTTITSSQDSSYQDFSEDSIPSRRGSNRYSKLTSSVFEPLITFNIESSRKHLPKALYTEIPVMVRVKVSDDSTLTLDRLGLDLVLVVDVSGSMQGEKIRLVKKSLTFIIDNLGEYDRVSLIKFNDYSKVLCGLTAANYSGKEKLKRIVGDLLADGSTNIRAGMEDAFGVVRNRRSKNDLTSILLLSDGQDTMGNSMPDFTRITESFQRDMKDREVEFRINSFGYGEDHDENVLSYFSSSTGGNFYFIKNEEQISEAFIECVGSLMSAFANYATATINLGPNAEFTEYYGDNWKDSNKKTATIKFGYLAAGMEKSFVATVTVRLSDNEVNGERPIFVASGFLDYKVNNINYRKEVKLDMYPRDDVGPANVVVEESLARAQSAKAVSEARLEAKRGNTDAALSIVRSAKGRVSANAALPMAFKAKMNDVVADDIALNSKGSVQAYNILQNQQYAPGVANFARLNTVQSKLVSRFNALS